MHPLYNLLKPFASLLAHCDKEILSLRYRIALGRRIEKVNPQSFYDKIFWLSCNTNTSVWSQLADKYLVRNYVSEKIGESYLPKLYGVYDTADDIDFSQLPDKFVIKTNNGCASNILVKSKDYINEKEIRNKLAYWLNFPYGEVTGQRHYTRITPKIIAEEFLCQENDLAGTLIDYKFYCFNGKPMFCNVISERVFNTHIFKRHMYDMDWKPLPHFFKSSQFLQELEKPKTFEEMKHIAECLSDGFQYVRVDLYEVNGMVKFGEMTFMPGLSMGWTEETQHLFGEMIPLDRD